MSSRIPVRSVERVHSGTVGLWLRKRAAKRLAKYTDYRIPTYALRGTPCPTGEVCGPLSPGEKAVLHVASRAAMIDLANPRGWLLLAQICQKRLRRPAWAVKALRTALVYVPGHPVLLRALDQAETAESV